jgi:hypothetical protein
MVNDLTPEQFDAMQRRRLRERELRRFPKATLASMHKANGGLMPLATYLKWSKDELVSAVMDDERHVHRFGQEQES